MLEIAGLTIAGVAALGTIVQAYYSAKAANKDISKVKLKNAKERAKTPLKIGIKRVAEVIDDELLIALQSEISKQNRIVIDAFQTTDMSDSEREQIVEAARYQICKFLLEVKKFNKGDLPTKRLQKLWSSNKCN